MKKLLLAILLASSFTTSAAFGNWTTQSSTDEMTGEVTWYASSSSTKSTKPNTDRTLSLGIGCSKDSEWAYFSFDTNPIMADDITMSGFNLSISQIKFNEEVSFLQLKQYFGSRFLSVMYDNALVGVKDEYLTSTEFINNVSNANTSVVNFNLYGSGIVYYKPSLSGSSKAISYIRKKCAAL